jgi:hypothetical protein
MLYNSATLSGEAVGHPRFELFETGTLANIAAIRAEDSTFQSLAHGACSLIGS